MMHIIFGENRREQICTMVALAVGLAVMLPLFSMLMARSSPYERTSGEIVPANPHAGDIVSIHWVGDRKRSCFGTVNRHVVDSQGVVYSFERVDAVYANLERGINLVRDFAVPKQAAPGPAIYRATTLYICNPVQRLWPIEVQGPDVHFNIAQ